MQKVNIKDKLPKGSKMLSGRPYGENAREYFKINEKDNTDEDVLVIIDEEAIRTIAPSFILGLFSESIKLFGKENFLNKYKFKNQDSLEVSEEIMEDIMEGVDWAVLEIRKRLS